MGEAFVDATTHTVVTLAEGATELTITVYEKGTEAAAATAVTIRLTSMPGGDPDQVVFSADHPFLFMIRHVTTNQILFLGRVMDPRG